MASNTTLDAGTGGDVCVTKERMHDGDAAKQQGVFLSGVTGTEGSYTFVDVAGGGGVEAAALRVTIASDSTGVLSVDDNGASLTVDGTVTANLSATDNAVLDDIAAQTTTVAGAVSGTEMQVDVVTSALPTGAATAAKQPALGTAGTASTDVISVQGIASMTPIAVSDNSGSLTVDNAALSVTGGGVEATALRVTLASDSTGVVSVDDNGGSLTVDGAVTVTGAAAEDAAASGNPVLVGGRYDSSARTLETGDVGAIALNASGQVLVEIAAGAGSGGTAAADDADFTAGTTSGTPAMGVYESTPTTVTDGDLGTVGITSDRQLKVSVGNTVTVGSHAVTNAGTFAVQESGGALTALQVIDDWDESDRAKVNLIAGQAGITAGAGAVGASTPRVTLASDDPAVVSLAALDNAVSGNELQVDVVTLPNVTLAAGTNTNEVVGDVAHDAAAAGNPVQTGGYATNSIEGVTQVAAGDLTRTVHDLNGVQVVRPHTTLEELISERVSNTDGASTAFTNFAAGGSGVHNYITQVSIWNSSATDGYVDFRDGTGGSVKWTFPAPQTGGCNMSFDPPLKFADNTAVAFDVSGAISTIYISVNGFQAQG